MFHSGEDMCESIMHVWKPAGKMDCSRLGTDSRGESRAKVRNVSGRTTKNPDEFTRRDLERSCHMGFTCSPCEEEARTLCAAYGVY